MYIWENIKNKIEVSSHPSIPVCLLSIFSCQCLGYLCVCVCVRVCVYNAKLSQSFIHKFLSCFFSYIHMASAFPIFSDENEFMNCVIFHHVALASFFLLQLFSSYRTFRLHETFHCN